MSEGPDLPTHADRMRVAREYATWHLGCSSWADKIVNAYFNPKAISKQLQADKDRSR